MDVAVLGGYVAWKRGFPFPRANVAYFVSLQCMQIESSERAAVTMPTVILGISGGLRPGGGQQQFATQTLCFHSLGIENVTKSLMVVCLPMSLWTYSTYSREGRCGIHIILQVLCSGSSIPPPWRHIPPACNRFGPSMVGSGSHFLNNWIAALDLIKGPV